MNIIENVARAIAQVDERNGGAPYEHLITMGKHVRENLDDRARAAIMTVRNELEARLKHDEEDLIQWLDDQLG